MNLHLFLSEFAYFFPSPEPRDLESALVSMQICTNATLKRLIISTLCAQKTTMITQTFLVFAIHFWL